MLWYLHHTIYEAGYNAASTAYKAASDKALAQAKVAAQAEATRIAALNTQTVNDYANKLQAATHNANALNKLLRSYSSQLRSYPMPGLPTTPSGATPASTGTTSLSQVTDDVAGVVSACSQDDAQLSALISWVGSV